MKVKAERAAYKMPRGCKLGLCKIFPLLLQRLLFLILQHLGAVKSTIVVSFTLLLRSGTSQNTAGALLLPLVLEQGPGRSWLPSVADAVHPLHGTFWEPSVHGQEIMVSTVS